MLTCIARSKAQAELPDQKEDAGGSKPPDGRTLTSQIKDMALKASGAYKNCAPCTTGRIPKDYMSCGSSHDWSSDRFRWSYRRTGSISVEGTPSSASSRRVDPVVFVEELEPKEWVAQVEPGVLITFVSLPGEGNDLKRIRFSQELFNKWQAQRWWSENYDRVMELYNVQRCDRQVFPLPTMPISEDDGSKAGTEDCPVTPPSKERPPPNAHHLKEAGIGSSSSDSTQSRLHQDSHGQSSTPKLSSISGAKTETSSIDASLRTSSLDRSGDLSVSNTSDAESEWVEQDEPGVYITIRSFPNGTRELRRVRFSRERFGEMHAKLWWEENRARVHRKYL